ncbi:MAG: thioeseterase [Paracoccus sp.]|jgi:acyl-CoA thioesterase FadM|uniref:acyl-CoA thioesterase n=1 Tax=Paracoccus sp. TaxID=267 RepID=UPI000C6AABDA|nr:acyl-CoA thioesterase [uncultured Paracoccus sp.]MAN57369.1 thioeseterase [Paracoccus sp. (in: a-proteobacteria)]MDB2552722.1 thioesterase family protein [Paracoccus sp. (in: a-proteobacteria)]|tara:strand:+ start:778 stop:1338 length:561 start_codon:yes stop_codon:yes gene_type:complete
MYPLIRFAKEMIKFRGAPPLGPMDAHVSTHRCWPWDLDPWIELNNGRTLTLYDLGRIPLASRTGLVPVLREKGWGITVAGNSTRYRRRIRAFERFTMISRMVGWDDRFIYMDQSMWKGSECCNQVLIRSAVTSRQGIVPPPRLMQALGHPVGSPDLPGWVQAWIDADAARPWPPLVPDGTKGDLPV